MDQFENQSDERATNGDKNGQDKVELDPVPAESLKCVHCGIKFCSNQPEMYVLMHERSCQQNSEDFLKFSDPQSLGATDNMNAMPEKSLLPDIKNENEKMDENWAEKSNCPICEFNMEKFKVRDKSDHLYGHFKDRIKDWFSGMKVVYDFPSGTCPQCRKEFKDEHCLYKHLGSVHNLYQTFIQRRKMEAEKKDPTTVLDESIYEPKRVKDATKYNKSNLKICKIESKKKSKVSTKTTFPKTKEVSKHVKHEPSLDKQCRLCFKKFTNSHRLRYHYSLVHFSQELEVEMYPLFENNNGSCPRQECPKVFKKFKLFMCHIGSIHREVDKYAESANFEDAKISQISKKNDPCCKELRFVKGGKDNLGRNAKEMTNRRLEKEINKTNKDKEIPPLNFSQRRIVPLNDKKESS